MSKICDISSVSRSSITSSSSESSAKCGLTRLRPEETEGWLGLVACVPKMLSSSMLPSSKSPIIEASKMDEPCSSARSQRMSNSSRSWSASGADRGRMAVGSESWKSTVEAERRCSISSGVSIGSVVSRCSLTSWNESDTSPCARFTRRNRSQISWFFLTVIFKGKWNSRPNK